MLNHLQKKLQLRLVFPWKPPLAHMPDDIYQQAKEIFNELLDVDDVSREARLDEIHSSRPELASEVRSLLQYHTSQSLVVPASGTRIRTRSTLSTSYQENRFSWLYSPLKGFLLALPLFLLGAGLAYWAHHTATRQLRSSVASSLTESVESRLNQLRQWENLHVSRARSWSQHPQVVAAIQDLIECSANYPADSFELNTALQQNSATRELSDILQDVVGRPIRYMVWDRRLLTLTCSNQGEDQRVLGKLNITPSGASMIAPALKGNARLFLPLPGRKIIDFDTSVAESENAPVYIIVPIFDSNAVIAVLLVHDFELTNEFQDIVQDWSNRVDSETFLVNQRGILLTPSRFSDRLQDLDIGYDENGKKKRPLLRDPGADLLQGARADTSASAWPPTLLARQVTSGNNGFDERGYRNFVGQRVVGSWRWLPGT